ncbi:Rieske domain-containing protein [Megalops cyprinoides]|uniref:Rieske domain-containing protein n=1 Tax=Megalops cyprinoides TaxID=118141 RepID=UPI001863B232|nr:Rieske domain-containing protein [Megalops cyprinoides]
MSAEESGEEPYFIGRKEDIIQAKRVTKFLNGRDILVVHHDGKFYAMDEHCYHAGSSLENGDIEEFNNKLCIVCPKHKYKITLAEGEGIYKATNPKEKNSAARWFSKGIKQRVHTVMEVNGDIFVKISEVCRFIESDYYQTEEFRQEKSACVSDESQS